MANSVKLFAMLNTAFPASHASLPYSIHLIFSRSPAMSDDFAPSASCSLPSFFSAPVILSRSL